MKPHRYIYGQKAPWTKQQHPYRLARSAEVRRVDKTRKGLEDLRSESLGRQVVWATDGLDRERANVRCERGPPQVRDLRGRGIH